MSYIQPATYGTVYGTAYPYGSTQYHGHPLRHYVPHYQPRSDYLPGVVREGTNPTVNDLVLII